VSSAPAAPLLDEQRTSLAASWSALPDKPEDSLEATVRALWFVAAGEPRSVSSAADGDLPALDGDGESRFRDLVARRAAGVPLAHLTGRQRFMGLEMLSGPEALIPRRESELLARTALERARALAAERGSITVIDVCTGCGNIALSLAANELRATVVAADLSADAVSLARRNAAHLGLGDRVRFESGDLLAPFDRPPFLGGTDVVTCNPPYISSAKVPAMAAEISQHEPRLAFDGGSFGLDVISRLATDAPRLLRPASWVCLEVGRGQARFVADRFRRNAAYEAVEIVNDDLGEGRVVAARTRSREG
jgi:release factor glutamine methyltransferase